jgi:hypothetical protein
MPSYESVLPLCKIHGTAPITAILVLAISVALSTAIATLAKEYVENRSMETTVASFILYLFIVFSGMITFYTLLFFCCSFGGGMLADAQNNIENSISFYMTGEKNHSDSFQCNTCLKTAMWREKPYSANEGNGRVKYSAVDIEY